MRVRFSTFGTCASVRALWRRSMSLMIRTRMSLAVAAKSLRSDSVCLSIPRYRSVPSFVTPSTSERTSGPNCSSIVFGLTPASSMVSCKSPAVIAWLSIPACASKNPTSAGWVKYGLPEYRFCSLWASFENSYAFVIRAISASVLFDIAASVSGRGRALTGVIYTIILLVGGFWKSKRSQHHERLVYDGAGLYEALRLMQLRVGHSSACGRHQEMSHP